MRLTQRIPSVSLVGLSSSSSLAEPSRWSLSNSASRHLHQNNLTPVDTKHVAKAQDLDPNHTIHSNSPLPTPAVHQLEHTRTTCACSTCPSARARLWRSTLRHSDLPLWRLAANCVCNSSRRISGRQVHWQNPLTDSIWESKMLFPPHHLDNSEVSGTQAKTTLCHLCRPLRHTARKPDGRTDEPTDRLGSKQTETARRTRHVNKLRERQRERDRERARKRD